MPRDSWPDQLLNAPDVLIRGVREKASLNACIGPQLDNWTGLFWYTEGFRSAGRQLVNEFVENGQRAEFPIDTVVYPIVFVYRHHFELLLKLILREYDIAKGGKGNFPKGHKLVPLWASCRTKVEQLFAKADWSQNTIANKLFRELDAIDPLGQAARYPHDTLGKKSFDGHPLLNIEHFADTADRLSQYLNQILAAVEGCQHP